MDLEEFENMKHQIGSCGDWCGNCIVGNGVLRQLTKKYHEIITTTRPARGTRAERNMLF